MEVVRTMVSWQVEMVMELHFVLTAQGCGSFSTRDVAAFPIVQLKTATSPVLLQSWAIRGEQTT
jgi:hypothetical protein